MNARTAAGEFRITDRIVGFCRYARAHGYAVGVQESQDALRLAGDLGVLKPAPLRAGLRSLLCTSRSDWERFDEVFRAYWFEAVTREIAYRASFNRAPLAKRGGPPASPGQDDAPAAEAAEGEPHAAGGRSGAAHAESLAKRDFRDFSDAEEKAELERLAERLAARMRRRISRRLRARKRGRVIDLRRTLRNNLGAGGTPIKRAFRKRHPRPVKPVILLDVSGSMSAYSRFFLRFMYGVVKSFKQADAFIFHTRLVHIRHALLERDSERAVARLALVSSGWAGGTRIGECLAAFNKHYAPRALGRRTVVMVLSDGLDTGAPAELRVQLAAMKARTKKIIWLNPLLGRAGYAPLAGGMAAALPVIDVFAAAHNLESLAALEPRLTRL